MQQVTCNRQIRGDQEVSLGLIEGFLKEFDEISAEWLLRGKGNQVNKEPSLLVAEPTPEYHEICIIAKVVIMFYTDNYFNQD